MERLTLCSQCLSVLIDKRLAPALQRIHDLHVIFCLSGEACDFPALDDRLAFGVLDTWEDGGPVAYGRDNTAISPYFGGNGLEVCGVGVVNESGVAGAREEDAVLSQG